MKWVADPWGGWELVQNGTVRAWAWPGGQWCVYRPDRSGRLADLEAAKAAVEAALWARAAEGLGGL